ncbi:Proline-rich receptor-like protein kinase PERK5 [Hibiscus syriacus]|uniref:non-specific serine/threonine protein kinase n=1 Tax=Hibiscus syriacus TaxID=106335 RepID=A0A6A3AQ33_HIBSY|nr:Proline-rich receptor-like protein kinase PERK5 [Hibiscus syriacus]
MLVTTLLPTPTKSGSTKSKSHNSPSTSESNGDSNTNLIMAGVGDPYYNRTMQRPWGDHGGKATPPHDDGVVASGAWGTPSPVPPWRTTYSFATPSPTMPLGINTGTFTYEELSAATGGFSEANLLGQGGFGFVHKGVLPSGKEIAVKSLKAGSGQGEREFQAEVEIISRVHHRYLVSLVGYCMGRHQRMLVYEFLPKKTLEYHLHGSAKGLAYLHEDCHPRIIHRDIKSANILLDYSFEAKVSSLKIEPEFLSRHSLTGSHTVCIFVIGGDFGLARLSEDNHTHVSTRVMGTFGYLAPEYASSGKLTEKSDVYSFGVMLLELITGRQPVDPSNAIDDSLVDWARPHLTRGLEDGDLGPLVDPRLENNYNHEEMKRMIACAAAIRHSARKRPKMSQIVRTLEGNSSLDDLNEGVKPGYSTVYSSYGETTDYSKILLTVRSHRLECLLTGTMQPPPKMIVDEDGVMFVGVETASSVWSTVLQFFVTRSSTTVKITFFSGRACCKYLKGLPREYQPFMAVIMTSGDTLFLDKSQFQLDVSLQAFGSSKGQWVVDFRVMHHVTPKAGHRQCKSSSCSSKSLSLAWLSRTCRATGAENIVVSRAASSRDVTFSCKQKSKAIDFVPLREVVEQETTSVPSVATSVDTVESTESGAQDVAESSPHENAVSHLHAVGTRGDEESIQSEDVTHSLNHHSMLTRSKFGIFKPKTIVKLPEGRSVVGCKWLFILKKNPDGSISRYKVRLVAKGFSQVPDEIVLIGDSNDQSEEVVRLLGYEFALKDLGELLMKTKMSNASSASTPMLLSSKLTRDVAVAGLNVVEFADADGLGTRMIEGPLLVIVFCR